MPGFGPAPAEKKRRRNADSFSAEQTVINPNESVASPPLQGEYSTATQAWYATWAASPQAQVFLSTDWQRLQMLAPIVEAYFASPTTKGLDCIRQNESLLGATHIDRLRGRIKVAREPVQVGKQKADVTDIKEARRKRLIEDGS